MKSSVQQLKKLLGKPYQLTDSSLIESIKTYSDVGGVIDNIITSSYALSDGIFKLEKHCRGINPEQALERLFGFKSEKDQNDFFYWFFGYYDICFAVAIGNRPDSLKVYTNFDVIKDKRGRSLISRFLKEEFSKL